MKARIRVTSFAAVTLAMVLAPLANAEESLNTYAPRTWGQIKMLYRGPEATADSSVIDLLGQDIIPDDARNRLSQSRPGAQPMATQAYWEHEYIEVQAGSGPGCKAAGFWNAPSGQCGPWYEFPPDKVFYIPCSNLSGRLRLRIWSTDPRTRCALGNGVDARVYSDHIEICVGYWSLYRCLTNPYTSLASTYVYWN